MTDATQTDIDVAGKKKSKLPLIIGVVLAILGGAAGFTIVKMGLLPGETAPVEEAANDAETHTEADDGVEHAQNMVFIPVAPIVVTLGPSAHSQHLWFAATLEVEAQYQTDVEHLMPRIVDALNSFLQAVEEHDVANRDALLRLRVQMLHRVRLVVGADRVRDLLVSEFVLN